MIGKSLEDYWRTIGGLLENLERIPFPTSRPRYLRFSRRSDPYPSLPSTPTPESSLQVLTPLQWGIL